jgi:hypothetical protein
VKSLSIGDIQKNTSLLTKQQEPFAIVDKRKNIRVAVVYPIRNNSIIKTMAGKYKTRVKAVKNLEEAKEQAMLQAMREKYGLSN